MGLKVALIKKGLRPGWANGWRYPLSLKVALIKKGLRHKTAFECGTGCEFESSPD